MAIKKPVADNSIKKVEQRFLSFDICTTKNRQTPQEPVGLGNRRLQIDRSGPFFTVFLPHSRAMGLQIRQKLASLGPILADRRSKSDNLLDCGGDRSRMPTLVFSEKTDAQ